MAIGIIMILCSFYLMLIPANPAKIIALILIVCGIYRIIKSSKATNTHVSKKGYTAEARKACEKVTPKQKQDTTPPWEQ